MKKKARATGTVKYRFSVLKMAGKFNYLVEGEYSEIYIQKYTGSSVFSPDLTTTARVFTFVDCGKVPKKSQKQKIQQQTTREPSSSSRPSSSESNLMDEISEDSYLVYFWGNLPCLRKRNTMTTTAYSREDTRGGSRNLTSIYHTPPL